MVPFANCVVHLLIIHSFTASISHTHSVTSSVTPAITYHWNVFILASGLDSRDPPIKVTKGADWKVDCLSRLPTQWIFTNEITNRTLQERGKLNISFDSFGYLYFFVYDDKYLNV